jgi:hypothetical protein
LREARYVPIGSTAEISIQWDISPEIAAQMPS